MTSRVVVYELYVPELQRPFRAILDRPERLLVAWHRDCRGIHELLDAEGRHRGIRLSEPLWQIREYERVIVIETSAWYEPVAGDG